MLSISDAVRDKIVEFEIGSRAYYDAVACRPSWPGGNSGVTIGIGYDLGQHTQSQFAADWSKHPYLVTPMIPLCGIQGVRARDAMQSVRTIRVPYEAAVDVFDAIVLPRYIAFTQAVFPNCEQLSRDAFGALVDLVYNRGMSVDPRDPRRSEMRAIQKAMTARNYTVIPSNIRAMKRLWPFSSQLRARREWEAATFEKALPVVPSPVPAVKIKPEVASDDNVADELNEQELERVRRINYGTSDPLGR